MRCRALFLSSTIALGVCLPVRADLLYTVAFAQVSFESSTYAPDSFSFTTPSVIPAGDSGIVGQIIPVPHGEMNGYTFTEIVNETPTSPTSSIFFSAPFVFSHVRGDIDAIFFSITTSMNSLGVYPLPTTNDGYCIDLGPPPGAGCVAVNVPAGSLTISEAVPEPDLLALFAGAAGLVLCISQSRRGVRDSGR